MEGPGLIGKPHGKDACRKHLEGMPQPSGLTCPECEGKSISRVHQRTQCRAEREAWPWVVGRLDTQAVSAVYTDAGGLYSGMSSVRPHESLDHAIGWVLGDPRTNGIESFWALLKRGIIGSYHHVSAKHLQRYVDEYCWRANHAEHAFASILSASVDSGQITYVALTEQLGE